MKEINLKLRIPTSWKDIKQMRKEHGNKRMRHNVQVLNNMFKSIQSDICGYWGKFVDEEFKEKAFGVSYLKKHLNEAIQNLK